MVPSQASWTERGSHAKSEVPVYVLKIAFRKGTTDPLEGSMVDPVDLDLEDPRTPLYSEEGSNVSENVKREEYL